MVCDADMVLDVVLEVHRAVKTGADNLSDVGVSKKAAQHDPLKPPVRYQYALIHVLCHAVYFRQRYSHVCLEGTLESICQTNVRLLSDSCQTTGPGASS